MKANEAPEKLYIDFRDRAESTWRCAYTEKATANDIEYTRTDAFVDKAAKWIEHNFGKYDSNSSFEKEMFIEEFIKAMKL